MPGGIDPHTHLEMPFMGTTAAETFESGTCAALSGGTTMVVDFVHARRRTVAARRRCDDWDQQGRTAGLVRLFASTWRSPGGASRICDEMAEVVDARHQHLQALHGLQGRADGRTTTRCSPRSSAAPSSARCRWCTPRTATSSPRCSRSTWTRGMTGPEAHAYSRPPEVEGEAANRAIMIADAAGVPLYIVHVSCEQAHEAIRRARPEGHARLRRAADPAPDARRERVFQQGLGPCRAARDVARRSATRATRIRSGPGLRRARCRWWRPTIAPSPPSRSASGVGDFTKIPNGTGGLEDRLPVLWTKGVETGRLTHERVRRGDLDQHRQDPQHLSAEGRDRCRAPTPTSWSGTRSCRRRSRPTNAEVDHRLQRLRGRQGERACRATRCRAATWSGRTARTISRSPAAASFVQRKPFPAVAKALSQWKELTAPRAVTRSAEHMPIGV